MKHLFVMIAMSMVLLTASAAICSDITVRGVLEKVDGNTLTVIDSKKNSTKLRVPSRAVVVSRYSKGRIDPRKIYIGSVVNATLRDGNVILLVVEGEPK